MKKRILNILLLLMIPILLLTGCNNKANNKDNNFVNKVKIVIVDDNKKELFNKEVETKNKYLIDVLKENEEIKLEYEDNKYGAYITSLMGIDQKTTDKGMYYWGYYIDDEYAEVGISNCEIKKDSTYKFVYEYYES